MKKTRKNKYFYCTCPMVVLPLRRSQKTLQIKEAGMTIERIRPLVEGLDIEEIKTNLGLVGAAYKSIAQGKGEVLEVTCEDGKYRIKKGGRICRTSR